MAAISKVQIVSLAFGSLVLCGRCISPVVLNLVANACLNSAAILGVQV
jgi:hypothetical protein